MLLFLQRMPVTFHNADITFSLKQKKELKNFIERQFSSLNNQIIKLSFVFCSDEYLLDINKKFLGHDYYTDIITFPLSEDKTHIEAEIYISIERVKENSERYLENMAKANCGFEDELHRVMFHGVLHLIGHKDKTKNQKIAIRKMEEIWIKKFNIQRKIKRKTNYK